MRRPSGPNYNQHHQSIFVNRHISHAIAKIQSSNHFSKSHPWTRNSSQTTVQSRIYLSYPNCRNESSPPVSKAISPQTISYKPKINPPTQNITLPKHYSHRYRPTTNLSWQ